MAKCARPKEVPQPVWDWLMKRLNGRRPCHDPGGFRKMAASRTSCCRGQPLGGSRVPGGFRVATCTPSPQSKGDTLMLFYDFAKDEGSMEEQHA